MATDKLVDFDHVTDYISREAAISEIMSEPTDAHYPSWYAEKLKQIPAADVRPVVRGKWKEHRFSEDVYGAECSVCHTTWDYGTNFCPNCGADMRM